jgi:hypothetical protein
MADTAMVGESQLTRFKGNLGGALGLCFVRVRILVSNWKAA